MSDCSKIREAIPDIQNAVSKSLDKVWELWKQIQRLDYALHGPRPTPPTNVEKDDHETGSVERLEASSKELLQDLIDAETELRTRIDLLLGVE